MHALPARKQEMCLDEPFHVWSFPDGTVWTQFHRRNDGYLLRFPTLADFNVSVDGETVSVSPVPGVSDGTMEHLYLNQVLPLALSRQRQLVLHASAVEFAGNGVAFTGESGRGKSTLAASFATTGSRFLTDDGLQLQWLGEQCWITPSHPSVRLWEDSERALIPPVIRHTVSKAPAVGYTPKVRLLAGDQMSFCATSQMLRRIYFLGEGTASRPTITAITPTQALMELLKSSFLLDTKEEQSLAWQFDELVRLAALPIYYRLDYPRRYEALPQVRAAIIQHATNNEA